MFWHFSKHTERCRVLIQTVILEVQKLIDEGFTSKEIADKLGLKQYTLDQSIRADRLKNKLL